MNHMKRLAAFLLAAIMVFSLLPINAMATEDGGTPVCSGEATGCTGDVHVHPCPLYVAPGCAECGQTEGHGDTCTAPCTMQGNCTSAAHKEGCKSQIVCEECSEKGGSHAATCTVPCTTDAGCTSGAHKEGCKSLYCEHDVLKTGACDECAASAARIKAVQDLIDALPETVTNDDEAAALEAAFNAIDAAKAGLSEAEISKLNITKHTAALSAYDTYKKQPGASVPEALAQLVSESFTAYVSKLSDTWTSVWGEVKFKATTSFEVKLYQNSTLLATTSLKNNNEQGTPVHLHGDEATVTWHLFLNGEDPTWWSTNWEVVPTASTVPTRAELLLDGEKVAECPVQMSRPDNLNPVHWSELDGIKVARIGETYYESLLAAFTEAANGDEIVLLGDVKEQGTRIPGADAGEDAVQIPTDKTVTLNLGGYTYHGSLYGNGINLTVKNGTIQTWTAANAIEVENSTLTLDDAATDLTIVSTQRSAIRAKNGTTTINGGSYKSTAGGTTHALYVSGNATVTINDGTFRTEGTGTSGSAVMIKDDTCRVTVNGGHFSSNTATPDGTICITSNSLILKGGTFVPNENNGEGAGDGLKGEIETTAKYVEGYTYSEENGTYRIVPAKIWNTTTGKGYLTLTDAISKAATSDEIKLLDTINESVTLDTADTAKSITLDLNDKKLTSTITMANTDSNLTISGTPVEGSSIKLTATAAAGYNVEWYKDNTTKVGDSGEYTVTAAGVYSFQNVPTKYTITYDLDGGALASGVTNPVEYNINTDTFTLNNPTKAGYTFAGWKLNVATDPDAKAVTSVEIAKGSTGNRTYTATWTAEAYTITYELAGGALASGVTNPSTYDVTDTFTLNNPTKTGYTFAGWKLGDATTANTTVTIPVGSTGNRTYTATWTANTYTIRYNLDGGTLAAGVTNPTSYTTDTANFTLYNPTKTGYTFKGWTANETFLSLTPTVTIAQGSMKNYSFQANWEANKYNIVFNANDGSASPATKTSTLTYDVAVVLPSNTHTDIGFTAPTDKPNFVGWNTKADGTGTTYAAGTAVKNLATGETGNTQTELYAMWADKVAPTFTITNNSVTYNGKPQGISFSTNADTSKITITYTPANAQARLTSNNPTNAGTYDVTVSIEDPNFSSVTYSFPGAFTIKKAPLKVYYQSETIYAGHAPKWQMVFEGFVNDETTSVLDVKPTLPAVKPTALGTHEILPSGGKDDNYEIEHVAGQLIIKEKVIYVYSPDKLLQTGEAAWLIPVLAFCGVAVLAAGAWISLRKKSYER